MRSLLVLFVMALLVAGASAADSNHDRFVPAVEPDAAVDADADTYTGPAPLTVRFTVEAPHATKRTTYTWSFDDRGASSEPNPVHTFARPGWYAVSVDVRDGDGPPERVNLMLHAWRPRDWARLEHGRDMRIVRHGILELQRKNAQHAAALAATTPGGVGLAAR